MFQDKFSLLIEGVVRRLQTQAIQYDKKEFRKEFGKKKN